MRGGSSHIVPYYWPFCAGLIQSEPDCTSRLILHQTETRLACQINRKSVITIQSWFELTRHRSWLVCVRNFLAEWINFRDVKFDLRNPYNSHNIIQISCDRTVWIKSCLESGIIRTPTTRWNFLDLFEYEFQICFSVKTNRLEKNYRSWKLWEILCRKYIYIDEKIHIFI